MCHGDKDSDVTQLISVKSSIIYEHNTHDQSIKIMYIYRVLANRESYTIGFVPSNFDPEYSVEGINYCQY